MVDFSKQVVDHLQTGVILLDSKQRITIWNRWLATYTGRPKEEVLGQYLYQLYPLFQKTIYQDFFRRCLEDYQGVFCSSYFHPLFFPPIKKKKTLQNMQISYISNRGEGYILLQVFDVTAQEEKIRSLQQEIRERERVERELKESRDKLGQITHNMQDMVSRIDPDGQMVYVSPSHEKILGLKLEKLQGESFYTYIHPQDRERVYREISNLFEKGSSGRIEFRYHHPPTPVIWVESTIKVIKEREEEEEEYVGAILTTRDISERKKMEEALRENEEQLDSIMESLDDGIFSKDPYTKEFLFLNKSLGEIYGLTLETLKKNPSLTEKVIHPHDAPRVHRAMENILHHTSYDLEYRIIRPNGEIRWIRDRTRVIWDSQKKPLRLDGTLVDTTASKEAEVELKAREDRFRTLVEAVPDIILQVDSQGRLVWTNDEGEDFFGLDYQQHHYKEFFLYSEEAQKMEERIEILFAGQDTVIQAQAFLRNRENERRLLEWHGKSLKKEERVIGVLLVARDISKIRETEASLKEKSHLLEGILNGISDIIAVQRPDHTIQRFNKAGYQLVGLSPEEVRGQKCYEFIGRDRECENCATKLAIESKQLETVEKYVKELDKYLNCRSNPILDEEGEVSLIVEQLRDITPQKRLEEEIRHSEENLRSIISLIPDLLVTFSPRGEYIEIWAKDIHHHHLPREELLRRSVDEVFPPQIANTFLSSIQRALRTKKLQTFEYSLDLKERREFEARLLAHSEEEILAIIRDITLRKRREKALKEEMERARQLQESLLPSILPSIPSGRIAAQHQQASQVSGDYYDFRLKDNHLYLLMADVTGHGFDASLVTIFVSSFFKRELSKPQALPSPLSLLKQIHYDFLHQGFSDDYSLEIFFGLCNLETMSLQYAVAGAIRSLLIDHKGVVRELPHNHGMIINNVIETPHFGVGEVSIEGGESLLIYTDGIDEPVFTEKGCTESWVEKIGESIGGLLPLEEFLERIIGDTTYLFQDDLVDDMTIIGLSSYQREREKKRWVCPKNFYSIQSKTQEIITYIKDLPIDRDLVAMALAEALSNAIDHGQGHGTIPIEAIITPSQLLLSVLSRGPGFNWRERLESVKTLYGSSERGRGLTLIQMTTHRFTFNEKGDRITMAWDLKPHSRPYLPYLP